jgi:hypothetical protein
MMRDYVKEKVLARGKKISMRKGLPDEANPASSHALSYAEKRGFTMERQGLC